jgi:hypothetical protein
MTIKEDLEAAHWDYLQDEWDKNLLEVWRKRPNAQMTMVVANFTQKHDLAFYDINKLKRAPLQMACHWRCRITRYVAAFMPRISTMLFDGLSDDKVFPVLQKTHLLNKPSDSKLRSRETSNLKAAIKAASVVNQSWRLVKEQRASNSRSNWTACK